MGRKTQSYGATNTQVFELHDLRLLQKTRKAHHK